MKGISLERIDYVKDIDLIQYVIDKYNGLFYQRQNGELVYKANRSLVIYKDHAYDFSVTRHAYKDSIYVERLLGGSSFVEAIERIEAWKHSKAAQEGQCFSLNIFNNLSSSQTDAYTQEDGFMIIPDGIEEVTDLSGE